MTCAMSEPLKITLLIKDGTYLHRRVIRTVYFIFADSTGRGGGWDRGLGDLFVLTQAATCGENGPPRAPLLAESRLSTPPRASWDHCVYSPIRKAGRCLFK